MSEETKKETGKKGNILKIAIIILLAALLIGGGTFGGYYVSTKLNSQKTKINVVKSEVVNKRTFALDEFLINLKADNAQRFIKAKIFVGYEGEKQDKKFEEELTDKKAILRDNINSILRNKKPEEFTDNGIQKMKEEIKQKINPFLQKGQVTDVYFSDILVQ